VRVINAILETIAQKGLTGVTLSELLADEQSPQ
jgi:hypothetical protein